MKRKYSQRQDLLDYRKAITRTYKQIQDEFLQSSDTVQMHKTLLEYGVKEPYATNILIRLFIEAYGIMYKFGTATL